MKTNVEIRQATREILSTGWLGRVFVSGVVLYCIVGVVMGIIFAVFRDMEIQTWGDFMQVKLAYLMRGMNYTVPSRGVALEMS